MERAREEVGEYAAEGTAPAAMERPTVDEPCADDGDDAGPRVSLRIGGEVVTIGVPSTYPQVGRLPRAALGRTPSIPPSARRAGGVRARRRSNGRPWSARSSSDGRALTQRRPRVGACHTGRVPPI